MGFRGLTQKEILDLESRGCRAESWDRIRVDEGFRPERVRDAVFSGDVELGRFEKTVTLAGGIPHPAGVYNARLHNCRIGNDACVADVKRLAHYTVGEGAILDQIENLAVDGETSFGNGTPIDVFNEAGGRTLKLFDRLSAQFAYFTVFYRHRPGLVEKLDAMVDAYAASKRSGTGVIGRGARIQNAGVIRNVAVGPFARISGARHLESGTIASCEPAPAFIGTGVVAKHFMVLSGSSVDDGALLNSSFVGQAVRMGKQYSAENSVFFANSELFHGEGCSIFAGPYTVTHHKSTLLIAGFFSFYNAGSGTNQSNHMYKLGPVHQGILERGSKTGSFSYLLWPARVGPFTNVIGKHYTNFDAADLPFAFVNEENGKSVIVPGMNLFTVGTRRDGMKWPTRDGRKDPDKLDLIRFDVFSPYTAGKMVRGVDLLRELQESASSKQEFVSIRGIAVNRLMLRTCAKYYELGIKIFIGNTLVKYLDGFSGGADWDRVRRGLANPSGDSRVSWVDACGMLARADRIETLADAVENGEVGGLQELQARFRSIHDAYEEDSLAWCSALLARRMGVRVESLTPDLLKGAVVDWKEALTKLNNMILQDAAKEFSAASMIGYGKDGGEAEQRADFRAVRGTFDGNSFVRSVHEESAAAGAMAARLIAFLDTLKR